MIKALVAENGEHFEDVICMQEVAMIDTEAEAFKTVRLQRSSFRGILGRAEVREAKTWRCDDASKTVIAEHCTRVGIYVGSGLQIGTAKKKEKCPACGVLAQMGG